MSVRVLVIAEITPGEENAFEVAFAAVAAGMKGTPGHIRDGCPRHAQPQLVRARG